MKFQTLAESLTELTKSTQNNIIFNPRKKKTITSKIKSEDNCPLSISTFKKCARDSGPVHVIVVGRCM